MSEITGEKFWCFGCKKYHPIEQKAKSRKKAPFYCNLAVERQEAARKAPALASLKRVVRKSQYDSGESGAYFAKKFS